MNERSVEQLREGTHESISHRPRRGGERSVLVTVMSAVGEREIGPYSSHKRVQCAFEETSPQERRVRSCQSQRFRAKKGREKLRNSN